MASSPYPAHKQTPWGTVLRTYIDEAVTGPAGPAGPAGAVSDASLTAVDANAASAFRVQQDARQSAATGAATAGKMGITPGELIGVTTAAETTATPRAIDHFGGYWWGVTTDNKIHRSADGSTWTLVATVGFMATRLFPTVGGEVLAATGATVLRSTGWVANPATATWGTVLTVDATDSILGCGIDTDEIGQRFIVTGYNGVAPPRTTSNKVWISTNAGVSFSVVYDNAIRNPGFYTDSHVHAVAHDRWANRWWISEGHGSAARGLYYSNDNGGAWTRIVRDTIDPDGAPFTMVATDGGLVCGSDSIEGSVFVVRRTAIPSAQRLQVLARRGLQSFNTSGQVLRGYRDSTTGLVYLASDNLADANYPLTVWASDGTTATLVHAAPSGGATFGSSVLAAHDGQVKFAYFPTATPSSVTQYKGTTTATWGREPATNKGNISGGLSSHPTSVVVGPVTAPVTATETTIVSAKATNTGTSGSTLIGYSASTGTGGTAVGAGADSRQNGVAVGRNAIASADEATVLGDAATAAAVAVAVGRSASATGFGAVAVGASSSASGSQAIALGRSAAVTDTNAIGIGADITASNWSTIAIGQGATSSGHGGVSLGQGSSATQTRALALGREANAGHDSSVALGTSSTTTANSQVAIGIKHLELTELAADAAAPAVDKARWYVKDNGGGKTQLCVRFNTGAVQVIATEP